MAQRRGDTGSESAGGTGAGATLRALLSEPGPFVVPGVPNALFGRIAEELGFRAVFFTGAGFANMDLGLPDLGLTTMTEIVEQVGRLSDAVGIPVIADADTGYGNAINVYRTVRDLERAGAAAVTLEDQVFPKRCGHFEGKEVVPAGEMTAKIRAACDARRRPATVIIARTDARAVSGLDEAIDRARAYAAAGAEVTFVEAPLSAEELARIPHAVPVPQLVNVVEGGKTPVLSAAEYGAMGFKIILYANAALRAAVKGARDVLAVLAAEGSTRSAADAMVTWEERQRLVRLAEYEALGRAAERGG
jgi:2-methylisocitrate lyase-like PEP mutase family enzyme